MTHTPKHTRITQRGALLLGLIAGMSIMSGPTLAQSTNPPQTPHQGSGMSGEHKDGIPGHNTETDVEKRLGVDAHPNINPNANRPEDCLPTDPRPECQVANLPEVDQRGATPGDSSNPGARQDSPSTKLPDGEKSNDQIKQP